MRILIIGNDYSADKFYDLFELNSDNIVFTTQSNKKNSMELSTVDDIVDFCEANEIDLALIIDENYINQGLEEILSARNITAFSPSSEAVGICTSKASAKRFMHKNKIPTPKFGVFEKIAAASDYLKSAKLPLVIKPDYEIKGRYPIFIETKSKAKKSVEDFYTNGYDKIVIEDYVEGKNLTVWTISDGYSAKIIGTSANYLNNVALFEPDFLTSEIKKEIQEEMIIPTISSLSLLDSEYVGVLGFDIILGFNNKPYLLGYKSFFDEMNTDFYTHGYNLDWARVFESCLIGDVFLKYTFEPKTTNMLTLRQGDEIEFISANTKSNLEKYACELELDLSDYKEAKKIWKYYQ